MIYQGDCLEVMATMAPESVDSIVTDPPYGLSFMGKDWDHGVPGVHFWTEALRVAKPGTHLLAFGGTRTFHRLACAIEDAGWEIRDCVMWVYGSGFPKSHDVSKAIDKAAGAERKKIGPRVYAGGHIQNNSGSARDNFSGKWEHNGKAVTITETAPATEAAQQWQGWGTALKPAWEPIIVARKPLVGTVADNVQRFGTGAVNVDGCRVCGVVPKTVHGCSSRQGEVYGKYRDEPQESEPHPAGRWPANLIHDGSDEVTGLMGEAARFFYCAKASKADRDDGCEGLAIVAHQSGMGGAMPIDDEGNSRDRFKAYSRNHHPTVKPTDLMRYLCRLVTPPGGTVLDPFCGSGSTGKAARLEGFDFIGIELNPEYIAIANARINAVADKMPLLEPAK